MQQPMNHESDDPGLAQKGPVSDDVLPKGLDQKPRGYQIELFEESLRRNIIISMPTGSGKTLVAAMRAREALEHCSNGQLVWFCAPKVQLAMQQQNVLSTQIPMFHSRLLTGSDNCEFWSQDIWDEVLKDTAIVVSTYAILLDALKHAFLTLDQLALLIFDEAHHAVKNHPASQIMQLFYHRTAQAERPAVLGMTATPVNKLNDLEDLERNLDAVCQTPEIFDEELQRHVHVPLLIKLPFVSQDIRMDTPRMLADLQNMVSSLNIDEDPWVRRIRQNPKDGQLYTLKKVLASGKTHCHKQLKSLLRNANLMFTELGSLASKIYIQRCIRNFLDKKIMKSSMLDDMNDDEQAYLKRKLELVSLPPEDDLTYTSCLEIRPKLQALIDFLSGEDPNGFTGLVFVKTRVEVAILSQILTIHPSTRKFVVSTFVGSSSFVGKKHGIHELLHNKNQQQTLDDLRAGRISLIITTDALEEGIDVVSCNVVICFEKPSNIRSYIQRRGRARNATSRYIVLQPDNIADDQQASTWRTMEGIMKELFWDEERQVNRVEEVVEQDDRLLRHESTGAQLRPSDTVAHLHHFCSLLSVDPFVDASPVYLYELRKNGVEQSIRASVRLPNILTDQSLRLFHGTCFWSSEKAARQDAAFEAYRGIFATGSLLNEHLLPRPLIDPEVELALLSVEIRPNVANVADQIDIWQQLSQGWPKDESACHVSRIQISLEGTASLEMYCVLPNPIPSTTNLVLYWNSMTEYLINLEASVPMEFSSGMVHVTSEVTHMLYSVSFSNSMVQSRQDFVAQFVPSISENSCKAWKELYQESATVQNDFNECYAGLVRDTSRNGLLFVLRNSRLASKAEILGQQVDSNGERAISARKHTPHIVRQLLELSSRRNLIPEDEFLVLEVNTFPKRLDFLNARGAPPHESAIHWLLADYASIERMALPFVKFSLFIPSILHRIEQNLIVQHLCNSILRSIPDIDAQLIREAILASSAISDKNYQRLEFLGDSILKLTTSLMLMASHLQYYERILSKMKDHIVSNARLSKAAIESGLDRYIITKPFVGKRWRPLYRSNISSKVFDQRRELSTKILADVVEAIIGAAHLSGGYPMSLSSIQLFLPQENWDIIPNAFEIFESVYENRFRSKAVINLVEQMSGYHFRQGSLAVEAITHPSHHSESSCPYERLEFLGDAVLDNIVTIAAFHQIPPLPVKRLHLVRSALVNADFLGFACLTHAVKVSRSKTITDDLHHITVVEKQDDIFLWQLLRHASPAIRFALDQTLRRLKGLQDPINDALMTTERHPWTLLAQLEPPKPLSDIVESILGAIYIDSKGDLGECEKFLDRIGLIAYLHRVLKSDVALLHPKEELGQLSNQDDVRYEMGQKGDGDEQRLTCTVHVGERKLVEVKDGLRPMHAQTKAAELACQILRAEKMEIDLDKTGNDVAEASDGEEMRFGDDDAEEVGQPPQEVREENSNGMGNCSKGGIGPTNDDSDEYMTADE